MAVSIITSAVERGTRVLAIAETNIAVDNMTRRLARKGVAVLRLGRLEKVDCDMVEHTLEGQLQTLAEQETRRVKIRDPRTGRSLPKKGVLKGILKSAAVILTTCAGAGDSALRLLCCLDRLVYNKNWIFFVKLLYCYMSHWLV